MQFTKYLIFIILTKTRQIYQQKVLYLINNLPLRNPLKGFLPIINQGIFPCWQERLQLVDMISGGEIKNENSSLI
jgi:hypothetical protein